MLYKLEDYWIRELNKTEKTVGKIKRVNLGDNQYIDIEELFATIEELNYEIERLQNELQETKQDMEDNCIRRTAWEDSGMSIHDFI